jgi:hypothetical protein
MEWLKAAGILSRLSGKVLEANEGTEAACSYGMQEVVDGFKSDSRLESAATIPICLSFVPAGPFVIRGRGPDSNDVVDMPARSKGNPLPEAEAPARRPSLPFRDTRSRSGKENEWRIENRETRIRFSPFTIDHSLFP